MGGGLIFAVLTTVDRWMTLLLLGAGALGQYTVAALLASGMLLLAQVVSQQFYPRMAMAYGRPVSGRELLRMAVRQSEVVFALLAPVVVVIALVGPWAISIWLGNYAAGIPALLTLLAAYLVLLCGTGFWNLLIVVGRANLYAACQAAAILVQVLASFVFIRLGWGLMGIAMAAAASFVCLTGAGAVAAVRATR
jgi:O-antigen/teichoic acid export membrane protein